ncbi:MAG: hypothetical protein K2O94_06450 [Clostridiales bacterium]|nr:hypothetical protein [Clostridiales bacterium]
MERQVKKEKAIELMKKLNIYKPYIDGFEQEDKVCFYERYAGFWVYQEPTIEKKMKQIEKEYNCVVYAITHEFTELGELWDFLLVTNYPEEHDGLLYDQGNRNYIAFAYAWNKDDEMCSELGSIGIKSFGGGIRRVA